MKKHPKFAQFVKKENTSRLFGTSDKLCRGFKLLLAVFNEKPRLGLVNKTAKISKENKNNPIFEKVVYLGTYQEEYILGAIPTVILWIISIANQA